MERVYLKFMEYVIKLIDEIGDTLTNNKMDENLIKKLSVIAITINEGTEIKYISAGSLYPGLFFICSKLKIYRPIPI